MNKSTGDTARGNVCPAHAAGGVAVDVRHGTTEYQLISESRRTAAKADRNRTPPSRPAAQENLNAMRRAPQIKPTGPVSVSVSPHRVINDTDSLGAVDDDVAWSAQWFTSDFPIIAGQDRARLPRCRSGRVIIYFIRFVPWFLSLSLWGSVIQVHFLQTFFSSLVLFFSPGAGCFVWHGIGPQGSPR